MNDSKNTMLRQPADASACLCESCTCTYCHEECYGHCGGCDEPVTSCNSYQTGKIKFPAAQPEACEAPQDVPAESGPAPVAEAVQSSETAPGFDTADFDWETVSDLQLAEREYRSGLQLAQVGIRRMADGVAIAHEALATYATKCRIGKTGQFEKQTASFGAWCAYMGINRKAAERLLNVSALFDGSSPKQQKVLEELSPSLLYAAAQPSAPAELVEQVKSGDITTHKQYQELLDELKARDAALQEKDAALQQAQEAAEQERVRAKKTEQNIAALVEAADLAQTSAALEKNARETLESQRAKLLDEQDKHLARIAELEARPIGAAAPSEEQIARWRDEGAAAAREEANGALAALRDAAEQARQQLDRSEDKLRSAKNEANRLRETLEGRTDHLNAVEAELKALKAELRQARDAAKMAAAPSLPAAAPAEPRLVLCADCIFSPICCGISLFAPDDLGEGTLAQFREEELDEDAFDRRLLGCTAGITKESR